MCTSRWCEMSTRSSNKRNQFLEMRKVVGKSKVEILEEPTESKPVHYSDTVDSSETVLPLLITRDSFDIIGHCPSSFPSRQWFQRPTIIKYSETTSKHFHREDY